MTRTALLALSLAALAWLLRRPSEGASRPEQPAWDEPEDGIQPADPMTWPGLVAEWDPWARRMGPDPDYHEAVALAAIRRHQSGPIGPAA